jgi:hypothetical protein
MYSWLWRHLPGGTPWKVVAAVVLVAAVVVLLMAVVFPWAESHLPFLQVTVDQPAAPSAPASLAPASPPASPTSRR